mmetsp:Transcript_47634/g.70527  ORF Transcript_47634/g.70527 Transcript_47634/m.70527 type:complete len:108 (+) Transcript_47634:70-393(+)
MPALGKVNDGIELQISDGVVDGKPTVHRQHNDVERIQLQFHAQNEADDVANVGDNHEEPVRVLELGEKWCQSHLDDDLVKLDPEIGISLFVCVGVTICDDVELAQGV